MADSKSKRRSRTLEIVFLLLSFSAIAAYINILSSAMVDKNRRQAFVEPYMYEESQERAKDITKHSSIFQKMSGPGWEMWNRSAVLFQHLNLTCNWNQYRPFTEQQHPVPSAEFCAHPLTDDQFVSNNVVQRGRHLECDGLTKLVKGDAASSLYVDIGANIGTCVMQILLTTNATIVAFEPHPYNLFVMSSTFMKLSESLRSRINLFPVALGSEPSASTIHMASDNRGHAVVSKIVRINRKATFLTPMPIRIERLDDILKPNIPVDLIKMDAQGFECYIFDGMQRVLQSTRRVFFELEKRVLNAFDGCSPQNLWNNFLNHGFILKVSQGRNKYSVAKQMPKRGKINLLAELSIENSIDSLN